MLLMRLLCISMTVCCWAPNDGFIELTSLICKPINNHKLCCAIFMSSNMNVTFLKKVKVPIALWPSVEWLLESTVMLGHSI